MTFFNKYLLMSFNLLSNFYDETFLTKTISFNVWIVVLLGTFGNNGSFIIIMKKL